MNDDNTASTPPRALPGFDGESDPTTAETPDAAPEASEGGLALVMAELKQLALDHPFEVIVAKSPIRQGAGPLCVDYVSCLPRIEEDGPFHFVVLKNRDGIPAGRVTSLAGREDSQAPDWESSCEVCGASPVVPATGMCGPCTFGEKVTMDGNWAGGCQDG